MATGQDDNFDHHRGAEPLLREAPLWRRLLFLGLAFALFILANMFWQYLSSGSWRHFSPQAYRHDLATPLADTLLHPLSIFSHPWMLLVDSLLLGVIIFVPIIMAILYQLPLAAALVAVVVVFSHAPVLGLTMALACLLAGKTSLRSDMPFLAALLALLPVGLYLYFFTFVGSDAAAVPALQRLVLGGVLLAAVVTAILAFTAVLALAPLMRFRPGVVAPALAVLIAVSLGVFYNRVGSDELEYSIIAEGLTAEETIFEPVAMDTWSRMNHAEGLNGQTLSLKVRDDLLDRRRELISRCESFLARYPNSGRAPGILWAAAQAQSLQLDATALEMGLVKYSVSHVLAGSEATWQRLLETYPSSPQAALAQWRLGTLALRERKVEPALQLLLSAQASLKAMVTPDAGSQEAGKIAEIFAPATTIPANRYYSEAAFEVNKLLWLAQSCDALHDPAAAEALAAYLEASPYELGYFDCLGKLAGAYEQTKMGDHLKLAVALASPNLYERAEMLILLAQRDSDAAVQANYELGRLAMRTSEAPALPLVPNLKKAQAYFEIVASAKPNPWQAIVREHLAILSAAQPPGQ
ncbi:MAG: hypothetical protein WC869_09605 [Phycisphaerae bacterium]|jgi:hypothetical protein